MANDPSSSLTSLYTHLQTLIKKWVYDKTEVDNKLSNKENTSNKTTQWSNSPDDNKYPSEKLVKDSLDSKASTTDLINGLQNIGGWTIHTVYSISGTASAYDISSGLLYNQLSPVFFLVKNTIGDNEANATLKYYPNGDNITIMDTFSTNYSPIQQGVWKKDTWALFFCQGNGIVQLRCVFYDSSDIDDIKNKLGIDDLSYYVVSSVTKDTKKAIYNVNDTAILDGNGFYLKIPYYETSTDVRVSISDSYYYIKQGSVYLTESKANGHLLKLRFNSGIFEVLEIYDNDKLIPSFSDLSSVATTGSYNDLSDKPAIPSASTSTPSADTTSGSVGTGTTWARSNHTHPKSSLYAEATHNHTKAQITDFPTIPSKTSQLTNDSGFLTSHQSLSNYYNKSETNNYDVDFILGTQTASTSAWTGTTSVISSLRAGTTIFYKLPYASTSTSVTLNLTLKGGGTTGAKNVFYKNTTRVTTHFGVGQVVGLTYDGTAWYVISPSDNNSNNDSNYGGVQFKAGEALTIQTICCAKDNGQYYKVANGVVLDIRYPLIMTSSAVASGTITNAMYRTWYGVNIANTKSMTLTNGSQLFLEGTAYSNGKFTISSNVVTHTLTNGRYYIKVGTALSTTQIRFISDMTVYYYNGTTLKPVIKKEQIVDFPTIVTSWSNTPSNTNVTSEKLVKNSLDTKENTSNKVTSISSSSTDTQYPSAKAVYDAVNGFITSSQIITKENFKQELYTDLYDVMDCINVNFNNNNLDNIYLLDTVFNISNYNGLPSKNSSVVNDILRNNAVSEISLNKEFTPSTKYTLEFDYYTSVSNRNGFYFGADPSLEDGVSINNSDDGLQVLVDISNTCVQTFNGTSSPTNVYTHTSNLLTSGTHHIRIVRNNTNVTFYIGDVELYTYTNAKYNTIGLNKWGSGYNTISNIEIKIGD